MKRLTQENWIERAKLFHNNKFDYSLVEYKNAHTKVKIICPVHGVFEQNPSDHIRKSGCLKCKYENHYKKTGKSKNDFIKESNKIHENKYCYDKVEYKGCMNKVCIICKEHGEFWQTPNKHLLGQGCSECAKEFHKKRFKKINNKRHDDNVLNYIKKARNVHGDKYSYLSPYVSCKDKIKIKCNKCGNIFKQLLSAHLTGQGCPRCRSSHGENEIEMFLKSKGIKYITQYKFKNCRGVKRPLPFDFYLPVMNICIEYQGRQHFEIVKFNGCSLFVAEKSHNKIIDNDKIKKKYCEENNIDLLEISYKDNIIDKLEKVNVI